MKNIGTGANGSITKIRYNKNKKKILITGEFSEFNGIPAQSVVMLNDDGTRDEIFKIGKMEGGLANFACLLDNDNIVVSGAFTKYDGVTRRGFLILGRDGKALQQFNVPGIFQGELYKVIETQSVKNIVKLNAEGTLDETFMKNIGTGANGSITKIRYNKNKKKILITGEFSEFNGIPAQSVVMLNDDGTRDEIFKIGKMEGGLANFACLLDNDNIVVSGAFTKYDGVTRRGFLILGRDGKALQQFNVPGIFQGELYKVIETRTSTNSNGLLLLGDFSRFDGNMVRNAIMIEVDYE